MNIEKQVPPPAVWLGFSGALPFIAGALASLPFAEVYRSFGQAVLIDYGALILSFMGGVHWGAAMLRGDRASAPYSISVLPALIALPAALIGGTPGLILLAAGFVGLLLFDERETRAGRLPGWYPALRRPLSAIVVGALIVGAIAVRF